MYRLKTNRFASQPTPTTYEVQETIRIPIRNRDDIVIACQKGRVFASQLGFSGDEQAIVVIAVSEVANNIVHYAGEGEILLLAVEQDARSGVSIVAHDNGPGIPDIDRALQDGYSTGGGLGMGLSGIKRLTDEFEIVSQVGQGTTIKITKWRIR